MFRPPLPVAKQADSKSTDPRALERQRSRLLEMILKRESAREQAKK